jgi:hypothetical protein
VEKFSRGIDILLISLKKREPRGGVGALLLIIPQKGSPAGCELGRSTSSLWILTVSVVFSSKEHIAVWLHTVFHELQVDHDFA